MIRIQEEPEWRLTRKCKKKSRKFENWKKYDRGKQTNQIENDTFFGGGK